MNFPNNIVKILEHFENGGEIAYFSKSNPNNPTETDWNNYSGVNEDTLVCMAEIFQSELVKFEDPQKLTEDQMSSIKWANCSTRYFY